MNKKIIEKQRFGYDTDLRIKKKCWIESIRNIYNNNVNNPQNVKYEGT